MTAVPNRLAGRVAVVTAAARGIGRAAAERLAAEGAEVHVSDIDSAALAGLDSASAEALDATDASAVNAYFSRLERVDVLVHAVGWVHQGTIAECEPEDWRRSIAVTLDSAYLVARAAIPRMQAHGGSLIAIASVASSIKGFPRRVAYGAAKGGVIGLVKALAADHLGDGIRCNAVCPGTVDTPSLRERIAELAETVGGMDAARRHFIERQPAGRLGTPEEIAALCAYLASDDSVFVTGQAINVDGGITI